MANFLRIFLGAVVGLVLIAIVWIWLTLTWSYSEGARRRRTAGIACPRRGAAADLSDDTFDGHSQVAYMLRRYCPPTS